MTLKDKSIIVFSLLLLTFLIRYRFIVPEVDAQRQVKYYGVNTAPTQDFLTLSKYSTNTIIISLDVDQSPSKWQEYFSEADKYNFNIVVFPHQWNNPRPNCGWGAPFHGDDISPVKPMLDEIGGHQRLVGFVIAHEPFWTSCPMTIEEMTSIRSQIKDYVWAKHRRDLKIWSYVDNIYGKVSGSDINRIMDVAITWQYCIADSEGSCSDAKTKILRDREEINNAGLDGKVELVFLFQTFAVHGTKYGRMPNADEMYNWSCNFLATNALDGYFWYTWGAHQYSEDLDDNPHLWPVMNNIYNDCINIQGPSPTSIHKQGDADGDDDVDITDYSIWISKYDGSQPEPIYDPDFNNDGKVDGEDYVIWMINYNH